MDKLVAVLAAQAVGDAEEQVGTAAGGVVDMKEPIFRHVDLGTDDLRDEGDDVSGRILLSCRGSGDVRPLTLDMLFKGCDVRVVIGCEIYPRPDRDDGEEDFLGPEVGDHRVHVEVFLFLPSAVDAEEAL